MNYTGIIIGITTFLIIGLFHPIVIWAEYYFSKKVWPLFMVGGFIFLILSLISDSYIISSIFAVIAASFLWSINELFQQELRVKKAGFPREKIRAKNNV